MLNEIWKNIPGYRDLYQVSVLGSIRSLIKWNGTEKRILNPGKHRDGYLSVCLYKNKKKKFYLIHTIVLETFIGSCPPGMECRHLDGNPRNNTLGNLCWGTHSDNMKDRTKHGNFNWLKPNNIGELNGKAKLNNWIIRIIKQLLKQGKLSQKEISQIFNIDRSEISNINTGKRWGYLKNEPQTI